MHLHAVVLLALLAAMLAAPARAGDLAVIVHPDREVALSPDELAQIYLKRRRFWENGEPIVAVNRNSSSEARRDFGRMVFGKRATQLVVYWNRQYFRGVLPPATLASDEAVRRFVAGEPLAIGYIDPELVDPSIRVLLLLRDDKATKEAPGGPHSGRLWLHAGAPVLHSSVSTSRARAGWKQSPYQPTERAGALLLPGSGS